MGRPVYVELALDLARSFYYWNPTADISFHLVTDLAVALPPDLSAITLIEVVPGKFGRGFSPKLWLDELAPAAQTLFIDSDCLCFGPLDPVFDKLSGRAVTVIGELRTEGEFFGDIPKLRRVLHLAWIPVFVGAIYYLEKNPVSRSVYAQARKLESDYDSLGLIRLRGIPNDEPLIALGMAAHQLQPVPDDGTIKADAMHYRRFLEVDVLGGRTQLLDPVPGKPVPARATPVIFHFNSHYTLGRDYRRECCRLQKVSLYRWPPWLATAYAFLRHDLPCRLKDRVKNSLRPFSHKLLGYRKIVRQDRET